MYLSSDGISMSLLDFKPRILLLNYLLTQKIKPMKKLSFMLGLTCMLLLTACQKEQIAPSPVTDQAEVTMSKVKSFFPEGVLVISYYTVENNNINESPAPIRPVAGAPVISGNCFKVIPESVATQQAAANNTCLGSTYSICCETDDITLCIDYVVRPNIECD